MAKLYEVEVTLDWQNLNTLTGVTLSGEYELWNAGREHDVVNIFYTESAEKPTDESFYKALPRQNKAIIEVGEQPIWVKSEVKSAKLIISTSIDGEISENTADIATDTVSIKNSLIAINAKLASDADGNVKVVDGVETVGIDSTTTAGTVYFQDKYADGSTILTKFTGGSEYVANPTGTVWANRATATYVAKTV